MSYSFTRRILCLTSCSMLSKLRYTCIRQHHYGTARPHVATGCGSYEIRSAAESILNKKSQAANKGCLPAWELVEGFTTPHHKNQHVKMLHGTPVLGRSFGTT
jgi:hypothetical protein